MASPASDVQTSFPFIKLPLELRHEVYQHVLCPRVNILVNRSNLDPFQGPFKTYHVTSNLSFTGEALFRVSRQISTEASMLLASMKSLESKLIPEGKLIEPSDINLFSFLRKCRVVLLGNSAVALNFLSAMSRPTLAAIHTLVITDDLVRAIWAPLLIRQRMRNFECWRKPNVETNKSSNDPIARQYPDSTYFQRFLRVHLPNLKEVSVFVTSDSPKEFSMGYNSFRALKQMCRLLADGTIDVVRLLYTDSLTASYEPTDCPYAEYVIRPQAWKSMDRDEWIREQAALDKLPDKFSVTREDGNLGGREAQAACGWSKARAVFALRRYAPGEKRHRSCRRMDNDGN